MTTEKQYIDKQLKYLGWRRFWRCYRHKSEKNAFSQTHHKEKGLDDVINAN